jgi:hypothetical protein
MKSGSTNIKPVFKTGIASTKSAIKKDNTLNNERDKK